MPRAEDDEVTRDNSPEFHDGRDRDPTGESGGRRGHSRTGTAADTGLPADHAERTWGGDQDIDTAGVVPEDTGERRQRADGTD
jgi:hypothetical protein